MPLLQQAIQAAPSQSGLLFLPLPSKQCGIQVEKEEEDETMSKRKHKGTHGIYQLTCISDKCSRRFKVIYDTQEVKQTIGGTSLHALRIVSTRLTYPFKGCPFCGAWWPTGPLDGEAYPKRDIPAHVRHQVGMGFSQTYPVASALGRMQGW